jgi:hypothetical protein
MAVPNTVTLRCPLCSLDWSATKRQSMDATVDPDGGVEVSISLTYRTTSHVCTGFGGVTPAQAPAPKTGAKKTSAKTSARR